MALTDLLGRGAKPKATRWKLSDGGGLQLWVQPNGTRFWHLAYRYRGDTSGFPKDGVIGRAACG